MHVYRDTASIHDAHAKALGSELGELARCIEDLSEVVCASVARPFHVPWKIAF